MHRATTIITDRLLSVSYHPSCLFTHTCYTLLWGFFSPLKVFIKEANWPTACTLMSSRHAKVANKSLCYIETFTIHISPAPEMATAVTLLSVVPCSGSHTGAVRTSREVPGRSKETQPPWRGTCAAHGHLPALPRYCLRSCPFLYTASVHFQLSLSVSRLSKWFLTLINVLACSLQLLKISLWNKSTLFYS